ncbi:hypothetical protein M9458_045282 [Cirrhinus mrigala]|uniref:Ribosomal RNA methyltransferase SPB1-like C-terminal domain-containing protein n=1 Tax=Cirrhinus mrigala TaxID=683832 RepID=A0ABD0NIT0_CIRMR
MLKKMEQAKKKAEAVVNTVDISEREKMAQLKSIYKKAGVGKEKRDLTYVVAKKGVGRRVRRPAGVKGTFRVVDGRMKKDTRAAQRKEQRGRTGHEGRKRTSEKEVMDTRHALVQTCLTELVVSYTGLALYANPAYRKAFR